jgi:hypothetical protein
VVDEKKYYDAIVASDWRAYRRGKRLFTYDKKEIADLIAWFRIHVGGGKRKRWALPAGIYYTFDKERKTVVKHPLSLMQKTLLFTASYNLKDIFLNIYRPEIHIMNLYFFGQIGYKVEYSNEPISDELIKRAIDVGWLQELHGRPGYTSERHGPSD